MNRRLTGYLFGRPIYIAAVDLNRMTTTDVWRYTDTDEPVNGLGPDLPCPKCGQLPTPEGHDPCLGTLPGVKAACCGHGIPDQAYVAFDNGMVIRGNMDEN